jgi:hypothetical protein
VSDSAKAWIEVSGKLLQWVLVLFWNGIIGYLVIADVTIPVWVWGVYAPVMAAVGLPIAYNGLKAVGVKFGGD